jgi:hypothetical protein
VGLCEHCECDLNRPCAPLKSSEPASSAPGIGCDRLHGSRVHYPTVYVITVDSKPLHLLGMVEVLINCGRI